MLVLLSSNLTSYVECPVFVVRWSKAPKVSALPHAGISCLAVKVDHIEHTIK